MNVAIKILIEAVKAREYCNSQMELDRTLYDMLIKDLRKSNMIKNGGTGYWIGDGYPDTRPPFIWLHNTRITYKKDTKT